MYFPFPVPESRPTHPVGRELMKVATTGHGFQKLRSLRVRWVIVGDAPSIYTPYIALRRNGTRYYRTLRGRVLVHTTQARLELWRLRLAWEPFVCGVRYNRFAIMLADATSVFHALSQ